MSENGNGGKFVEVKGFMLLPPADGKCRICACEHGPEEPHNASSMFYEVRFKMRYGRDGTWADALAHCNAEVRALWEKTLREKGWWTEPGEGVKVVSEPIDG